MNEEDILQQIIADAIVAEMEDTAFASLLREGVYADFEGYLNLHACAERILEQLRAAGKIDV